MQEERIRRTIFSNIDIFTPFELEEQDPGTSETEGIRCRHFGSSGGTNNESGNFIAVDVVAIIIIERRRRRINDTDTDEDGDSDRSDDGRNEPNHRTR